MGARLKKGTVTPEFFIVSPASESEGEGEGKRPESTAASNRTCCTPTPPKLPRHELALLPVPLEESGTAYAAVGHAIKCPYYRGRSRRRGRRRRSLGKSAGCSVLEDRAALRELLLWFGGPSQDHSSPPLVRPVCRQCSRSIGSLHRRRV